jgi:ribosomal protein S18 acetylase RimI-like enzyme
VTPPVSRQLVRIRRATSGDLEALRGLYAVLFGEHAAALPDVLCVPEPLEGDPAEFAEALVNPACFFAVAEEGARVMGFIDASRRDPTDEADVQVPWCSVNNIAVDPACARTGIGTALLRAAEEWARGRGYGQMRLTVFEFNERARAFYDRAGYATLSRQLVKRLDAP